MAYNMASNPDPHPLVVVHDDGPYTRVWVRVRVRERVRVKMRARARRQVVVACDNDLARVRLRLQPRTDGLELLRPPRVREIARVDQAVARRQRPAWRRAVRVAHLGRYREDIWEI